MAAGATLRQGLDDNATLYGKQLENCDIVRNGVPALKAAAKLITPLDAWSAAVFRADSGNWQGQFQGTLDGQLTVSTYSTTNIDSWRAQ